MSYFLKFLTYYYKLLKFLKFPKKGVIKNNITRKRFKLSHYSKNKINNKLSYIH